MVMENHADWLDIYDNCVQGTCNLISVMSFLSSRLKIYGWLNLFCNPCSTPSSLVTTTLVSTSIAFVMFTLIALFHAIQQMMSLRKFRNMKGQLATNNY